MTITETISSYLSLSSWTAYFTSDANKSAKQPKGKQKKKGKRYHIYKPKGQDPISNLPNITLEDADVETIDFDDNEVVSVTLTDAEAKEIKEQVNKTGGVMEEDSIITIPPVTYTPIIE